MKKITLNFKFTSTPNDLYDLIPHLTGSAWKLLSILIRETLGWHCFDKKLSLSYLERRTGLNRTTILNAREELRDLEVLSFKKSPSGVSTHYFLHLDQQSTVQESPESRTKFTVAPLGGVQKNNPPAESPPPLTPSIGESPEEKKRGSKKTTPGGSKKTTPLNTMNKDMKKTHHVEPPPELATEPSNPPSTTEKNDDAFDLVKRLKSIGVHEPTARKLSRSHPRDLITSVLDRLSSRKANNPAAWVVAEIKAGGYGASRDQGAQVKEKHRLITERRQQEKLSDLEERSRRDLAEQQRVEQAAQLVSESEKDELMAEAQSRALKFAVKIPGAASLDSPIVQAEFKNLLLERAQQKMTTRRQPKERVTWSGLRQDSERRASQRSA